MSEIYSDLSARVTVDGRIKNANVGARLSEVISIDLPCGGHGRCGKCKVRAVGELSPLSDSEEKLLTEVEKAGGIRLACSARILGDCEIETLFEKRKEVIVTDGDMAEYSLLPTFDRYGVAIDIGTTTLASRLYDREGNLLSESSALNPQSVFGADVISRIEASLAGKRAELASLIREGIDSLISDMARSASISSGDIDSAVITGNTVMLYLLTESSPEALSHAPFEADRLFGETVSAGELSLASLKENAKIYLAPCIAAFVGADTVCALIAISPEDAESPSLTVDIGTNGEMAIFDGEGFSVCSTAAGPAFEGGGISCGMRGANGAIDKVSVVNGALASHVIGGGEAVGICGSGLVDVAACMLDLEIMDESGYLEDEEVALSDKVVLTQQDIRMLQLAKSAINAGMLTLVSRSGVSVADVKHLYIAGGFGHYLNTSNAARIGLIPKELLGRMSVVGNAALAGASMLLLDVSKREKAEALAKNASSVELSGDKLFADIYMNGMMFE